MVDCIFQLAAPKSNVRGLFVHHARSTKKGVQKSKNWMLRSIARALASVVGGSGVPKK